MKLFNQVKKLWQILCTPDTTVTARPAINRTESSFISEELAYESLPLPVTLS